MTTCKRRCFKCRKPAVGALPTPGKLTPICGECLDALTEYINKHIRGKE